MGKAYVQVKARSSVVSFAVGRRPYVSEASGALVVKAADEKDIAIWFPNGTGPVHLHVTATLALPSGPREQYVAQREEYRRAEAQRLGAPPQTRPQAQHSLRPQHRPEQVGDATLAS